MYVKRYIAILVLLFCSVIIFGQISIIRTDVFDAGDEIPQIKYFSGSTEGISFFELFDEENPVFDDLDWQMTSIDTLRFIEPSETDIENSYPEANCAYTTIDGFVMYLIILEHKVELIGIQVQNPFTGVNMDMNVIETLTLYNLPSDYQDEHSDTGEFEHKDHITVYEEIIPSDYYDWVMETFDTVKFEISLSLNSNFDKYGSMEFVGDNNFNGVFDYLREKKIMITTIDILLRHSTYGWYMPIGSIPGLDLPVEFPIIDTLSSYSYWTKNMEYPLAELFMTNDFENVTQVDYRYNKNNPDNFVESGYFSNFNIYPNPATDFMYFSFNNQVSGYILIFSANGDLTEKIIINQNQKLTKYNTENLSNGTYFYQITDKNGKYSTSGKFVKIK